MNKFKLLSLGNKKIMNIGDYIQALAASQFYPTVDGFVNREKLKDYDGDDCNMIMNGWYMHDPKQWPPSNKINPLFVSMHINTSVAEKMLSDDGIAYLKKYEPIGCRDIYTLNLLSSRGIKAYFSGCMTLTLGKTYRSEIRNDVSYFVDPIVETPRGAKTILKNGICLALHYRKIKIICEKYYQEKISLSRLLKIAGFYRIYTRYFTPETLTDSVYIQQESSRYATEFKNDFERLEEAKRLVKLYAEAKLVVTSRIHCALPCLGLETPVIYTAKRKDSEMSACRFDGLIDLFNVMRCDDESSEINFELRKKIDIDNTIKNKDYWRELASELMKICTTFVRKYKV